MVDARLNPEQADLKAAAAKLADDLGPGSVHELQDHDRAERIEAAVAAAGWRSLRADGGGAVELALVAEEFARGLVDAPFLGPVTDGAPRALGIVVTAADLLGAARGAHALAVEYAKLRAQYGHAIGGYQAVSHPLAEGLALIEGMTSIVRYAAWTVDEAEAGSGEAQSGEAQSGEALRLARMAKLYCARSARDICETAIQVHGGIGNTWECLAHFYLRRVLAATELFPVRLEEVS
jgi:hypothetical protein